MRSLGVFGIVLVDFIIGMILSFYQYKKKLKQVKILASINSTLS